MGIIMLTVKVNDEPKISEAAAFTLTSACEGFLYTVICRHKTPTGHRQHSSQAPGAAPQTSSEFGQSDDSGLFKEVEA